MKFIIYIFFCLVVVVGQAQDENNILSVADSMPRFPEGNSGITKFIQTNLHIPFEMRENGILSGKAIVKFVVDTSGKVLNPTIIKSSLYKSFDEEAVRVISKMPLWTPAFDKNKKVKIYLILPVSFKDLGVVAAAPVTEEHEKAMKYWNEGHKLEKQEKFDKALEKFDKSLSIESNNSYAMFDKAKMHLVLADKNKACELFAVMSQKNVRKDEADDFIKKYCAKQAESGKFFKEVKGANFFNYGMDDVRTGRYEVALHKFDSCLKYCPQDTNALFNKALMHGKLDQKRQACSTFKKLLEISPGDKEAEEFINKNCN